MTKKKPRAPEDENKLRPDVNETAFRVMREATGQAEKTKPPSERADEQKNPAAVERGQKGGRPSAPEAVSEDP